MKKLIITILALMTGLTMFGQVVFQSDFETWTDGSFPDGWGGSGTNIGITNVVKYTTSAYAGSNSCQLINATTSHKRFTTTAVPIESGTAYKVEFYAKGKGDIRLGIKRTASIPSYMAYTPYTSINSSSWDMYSLTIIADTTSSDAEFILSVVSTDAAMEHLIIDNVTISVATDIQEVSIHDIQYTTDPSGDSPYKGQTIKTRGVVTAVSTQGFWLQNGKGAWNGVYVYNNTILPTLGDSILISAIVSEYYNLTELTSVNVLENFGNATLPAPEIINIADAGEAYEGVLCKLEDVQCIALPDSYGMWQITQSGNNLYVDDDIYAFTPTINTHYVVTGLIHYSFSQWKILPRSANDVTVYSGINSDETNDLTINYDANSKNLFIKGLQNNASLNIINILGQNMASYSITPNTNRIDVANLNSGIYIVNLLYNNTITTKKILIP
ncbi:MAG TPA: T9SS type A sorting domain-containing protein [Bacteroidales bacterium]|nr:T9SS type A sorting domain-containing protein [Bacteroidales bacterium]